MVNDVTTIREPLRMQSLGPHPHPRSGSAFSQAPQAPIKWLRGKRTLLRQLSPPQSQTARPGSEQVSTPVTRPGGPRHN